MKRLELQKALLARLATSLRGYGFEDRPVGQDFYRRTPQGRWILHLGFVPHAADVDVTTGIGIRIDGVEELVNRYNGALSARDRHRTATMGIDLGNLADHRQRRWTLRGSDDVEPVAASIVHEFEKFGIPYLERFSDLEAMLEVLSRNDESGWLHSPIHWARCERAVALALILGRRDQARAIADSGVAFLAGRGDRELQDFRQSLANLLPEDG